jgi:heat shock protein HspQ
MTNGTITSSTALFEVGQIVHHRLFDYRGVVLDVDPDFQAGDAWYQKMARSRPPKDKPWYHVLVEDGEDATYVAERNLEPASDLGPISHSLLDRGLMRYEDGRYVVERHLI